MTGVIKAHDATSYRKVRPLPGALKRAPEADAANAELVALRFQQDTLSRQLSQRDAEIERLDGEITVAFQEGRLEGLEAGRHEADEGREARLSALEAGIADAVDRYGREISSLERLSSIIALESLQRVLGPSETYSDFICGIIRTQLEGIEQQSIIRIEVSRTDFPEPDALAALRTAVGRPDLDLCASDDLKTGDCRIKLVLGALEVGVEQQWSRLRSALEDLAEPRARA